MAEKSCMEEACPGWKTQDMRKGLVFTREYVVVPHDHPVAFCILQVVIRQGKDVPHVSTSYRFVPEIVEQTIAFLEEKQNQSPP